MSLLILENGLGQEAVKATRDPVGGEITKDRKIIKNESIKLL